MAIQIGDRLPHFKAEKQDGTAFDSQSIERRPVGFIFIQKTIHLVVQLKHAVLETLIKIFKIWVPKLLV